MVTSGGMECIDLLCRTLLDPGDGVAVEAPTYLGRDHGLRGLRGRAHRDPDGRARHARRRPRRALRRRLPPALRLRHPRVPEPVGADALARTPAGARRRLPPLRRPDLRGRRLPRAGLRRRAAAFAVVARPGRRAAGRDLLEDLLPRLPARAGRSGRLRSSRCWRTSSRTPTSARARSGSGWSRSTAAPGTSTPASRARGRCTRRTGPRCRPRSTRTCRRGAPGASRRAGCSPGSRCPSGVDTRELRPAATEAGVAYVPGRPFYVGDEGHNEMRLSFSHLDEGQLELAGRRLAGVLERALEGARA